jgi:chemotaxis methyl-accepting protein methylase
VVRECIEKLRLDGQVKVQIFATDIDKDAVEKARQEAYLSNIAADVTPDRVQRFFIKDESGFRVKKDIRELVVFAPQNIIMDSPFTKLDVLCCRNLLIYFTAELQKKTPAAVPLHAQPRRHSVPRLLRDHRGIRRPVRLAPSQVEDLQVERSPA